MAHSSIINSVLDLDKTTLLERSEKFLFSTGLNDGTSNLCRANIKYGLSQFHLIQEKYGFEPKATFITSPDETISRNDFRWNSGLGYGGRLNWGAGNEKIIFLNIKPNCCGILVGGLEEVPDVYEIIKKIDEIKGSDFYHQDVLINWDYSVSNHFINCYATNPLSEIKLPPYVFFIHGAASEFRDDKYGIGLYVDISNTLKDMAIEEETVFGKQYILLDSSAKEYLDFNRKALDFSNSKRILVAKKLFGDKFQIICNQPHQFLKDFNNMYLGSNCTDDSCDLISTNIFPTALRADISAYLFKGKKNLSETTLKNLNYYRRGENLGLLDLLKNVNILPHGGGYGFPDVKRVARVLEHNFQRYFSCELKNNNRVKIIKNVSNLQFEYRGREVVLKTLQMDLGEIIARLNPVFSLKV